MSNEHDELYVAISRGRITVYDYLGDYYNQGPNCYVIDQYEMDKIGKHTYHLKSYHGLTHDVYIGHTSSGFVMNSAIYGNASYGTSIRVPSDFSPECRL